MSTVLTGLPTGQPCDRHGNLIAHDAPPPPRSTSDATDWAPFEDQLQYETADFLFRRAQLSATKIDSLLNLWAASLIKHNGSPPFASAAQLYETIDSVKSGGRPWTSFEVRYTGEIPEADAPEWMHATYEVWYRDPSQVFADFLDNPDFNSEWDSAPLRQYDSSGERVWQNLMSGNWAWKQCVGLFHICIKNRLFNLLLLKTGSNLCR
jgi:hypothetical protein